MGNWVHVRAMKIRYIFIIFTLGILGTFLYSNSFINNSREIKKTMVDMTELNELYKSIENEINLGMDVEDIEKNYNCEIVSISDDNYKQRVNDALVNGKIKMDYYKNDEIAGKIIFQGLSDNYDELISNLKKRIGAILLFVLMGGYVLIYFIYRNFVKPFRQLQSFAKNMAKGNFETALPINKENYFGAFTESFDLMREELKNAKEAEYKANISKKELVASLSHDIKTPVATIEALCEILSIKVKEEEILSKIKIIHSKAKVIEDLINNMFHATLEELKSLKIEKNELPSTVIVDIFKEINHFNKIKFQNEIPSCLIYGDKLRLSQVIDNIINNSYKYADTDILVSFKEEGEGITVTIRDFGPGVNKEELPLLTTKYYRGENSNGIGGSGLGLFLSKIFMGGMDGELQCYSDEDSRDSKVLPGFIVILYLRKV